MSRLFLQLLMMSLIAACAAKPAAPPEPTAPEKSAAVKALEAKLAELDAKAAAASEAPPAKTSHTPQQGLLAPATPAPAPTAHSHRQSGSVPAEKALGWLKNGNTRFLKGFLRKDGQSKKDIQRLAKGQQPHSIILSCADSRTSPELVFDQKLGEIFVVRTAGPSLDPSTLASIEYAVDHLGSNLLVVMGHTSCGAVKATVTSKPGQDLGSPWINALVAAMRLRLEPLANQPVSKEFRAEGWANVNGVSQELVARSAVIREAVASGGLKIQEALYDTAHGNVEFK